MDWRKIGMMIGAAIGAARRALRRSPGECHICRAALPERQTRCGACWEAAQW